MDRPVEHRPRHSVGHHRPGVNADVLTGQTFFPHLIIEPFHSGLVVVFNPGRYAEVVENA